MRIHHEAHADLLGQANVVQHTCTVCGAPFESSTKLAKYCSKPCNWKAFNAARIADGRLAEYRAKNRERRKEWQDANRDRYLTARICGQCGSSFQARHKETKYCSGVCYWAAVDSGDVLRKLPELSAITKARRKLTKAAIGSQGHTWVAGLCHRCGTPFVSQKIKDVGRYCSTTCKNASRNARRRVRLAQAVVEEVHPYKVYERDGWRCYLCGQLVDKGRAVPNHCAPTLDHIVPLIDGGRHSYDNVKTAHFICNCYKSGHSLEEFISLDLLRL